MFIASAPELFFKVPVFDVSSFDVGSYSEDYNISTLKQQYIFRTISNFHKAKNLQKIIL
jgi:hypothetical protein